MRSIVRPDALAAAWLDSQRPGQKQLVRMLNDTMLQAKPTLVRAVKWGALVFQYEGQDALAIVVHKEHANLQVFNGAALAASFPALEGSGKGMRHLKFRNSHPPDLDMVTRVVNACVRLLRAAPVGGSPARSETGS